ncbi:MAG TPA: response regulator [Gemmatimonadaceae bacterium]
MNVAAAFESRHRTTAPTAPAKPVEPVVFVVDDDVSVRESLELLILASGWKPETFERGDEFLMRPPVESPSCLVLDVSLPDIDGLELQRRVASDHRDLPIIFITGHGDVPMSVRAMKAGAVEFLMKPFDSTAFVNAVTGAIEESRVARARVAELHELESRFHSLSKREREVMALVVSGQLNKQVAAELRISEITVKAHRGKAMHKMNARSFAELVKMASALTVSRT